MCMYVCVCVCVWRERERQRGSERGKSVDTESCSSLPYVQFELMPL